MSYHNPSIEIILPDGNLSPRYLENELLINRLHFIWLGSALSPNNAKNIPKWIDINDNCDWDIFIWYDSLLLNERQFEDMHHYVRRLKDVYLCDVRKYQLFDDNFVFDAYEYELGIRPRPGINPLTQAIRNYGMASDVLRMCILKWYGGFYMDVDMTPANLCEYRRYNRIKSCPLRFCIALSMIPNEENFDIDDPEIYRNIYDNYDEYYDYREKYGNELFESTIDADGYTIRGDLEDHLYEEGFGSGIINNGLYYDPTADNMGYINRYFEIFKERYNKIIEYRFYGYLLDFRTATIKVSGPGVFTDLFVKYDEQYPEMSRRKAILRDIVEDPEQSTHSWIIVNKHADIFAVLMYELFSDRHLIELAYHYSIKNYDDEPEVTINDKIDTIIFQYILSLVDSKIYFEYYTTPTYVRMIEKLTERILSDDNKPTISLFIDLINSLKRIPVPEQMRFRTFNLPDNVLEQLDSTFKHYMEPFIETHRLF